MARKPEGESPKRTPSAAEALQVDAQTKRLNDLAALLIALAHDRDSPTRTDFAHPRFKEIVRQLQDFRGK